MRSRRSTYLRWWQVRPIEFSLFLFPLVIQRTLVLLLYIMAAIYADHDEIELSYAMDATYAGLHAPTALKQIIILGWILLALAALSAWIDRCYKWPKAVLIFVVLVGLMGMMTKHALWVYEPYLALRR